MFQLAHMSCASMHLAHFPRWLGSTSASKWRTKLMRCGNRTGQRATGGTWKKRWHDNMGEHWKGLGSWKQPKKLWQAWRYGFGREEGGQVRFLQGRWREEPWHSDHLWYGTMCKMRWPWPFHTLPSIFCFGCTESRHEATQGLQSWLSAQWSLGDLRTVQMLHILPLLKANMYINIFDYI